MVRSTRLILAVLGASTMVLGASVASAQAVSGLGDDATTAPTGKLRISVQPMWTYADQRFGVRGSTSDTQLHALGAPFTLDTLGANQLPLLVPLQDSLRALAGVSGINVSLGRTIAQVTSRVQTVPINVETGITRWFSAEVSVPIVHTRSSIFFRANPGANEGNLGVNPALAQGNALPNDTAFTNQIARAGAAVASYCAGSGSSDPRCASGATLASSARGFSQSAAALYTQSFFVPTQSSSVQAAVDARGAALTAALNAFAAIPGSGVQAITATGLVGAPTPLATPDVQDVLSNPGFGVGLDPFRTIERTHLGDIEVTGKLTVLNTIALRGQSRFEPHGVNLRVAIGGGYRFATGQAPSPNDLLDVGTGTHAGALLARGFADVVFGGHFWTSVIARYAKPASDSLSMRIAPGIVFPPASTIANVTRQLGSMTEIEALPRWEFNDFVSIGGDYLYRRKAQDTYTSADAASAALLGALAVGSDYTEQRVGGGIVFSNAHAVAMHKSRIPVDVSFLHTETIAGRGGIPKTISDQILVRLYFAPHR